MADHHDSVRADEEEVLRFVATHIPAARARLGNLPAVPRAVEEGTEGGVRYLDLDDIANDATHRFYIDSDTKVDMRLLEEFRASIFAPHN